MNDAKNFLYLINPTGFGNTTSLLKTLMLTNYDVIILDAFAKDKILFIEDLDEYLYHIDRMMYNLKRNGYFENVKGIFSMRISEDRVLDLTCSFKDPIQAYLLKQRFFD